MLKGVLNSSPFLKVTKVAEKRLTLCLGVVYNPYLGLYTTSHRKKYPQSARTRTRHSLGGPKMPRAAARRDEIGRKYLRGW